ncbi:MAG: sterol desaturase family protein [Planctomycetes bacterium]|nr:sterol desaturase family protein [Planctomycetota bacterium]
MIEKNSQTHSDGADSSDEVRQFSRVDGESVRFGTGWISGVAAIALSGAGLLVVLCIRFPSIFTMSVLREYYPIPIVRALLYVVITSGFLFGILSLVLRRRKVLGTTAIVFALFAGLLGGAQIQLPIAPDGSAPAQSLLSVDWFVLNLMFWCALFIPLERWFALRAEQPVFRHGWRTDLSYFFASTLAVQWVAILTMKPAQILFSWVIDESWRTSVANQPLALQVLEILLVTDFVQYWIHRAFHRIPLLWRFHAIHHSAERMDWLAGSRLHIVDILLTRGCTYMPLFILGFADLALLTYGVIVTLQATFVHANLRFTFGPLRYFLVTPQFHHWHHSDQSEAIDKNFAIHLPIWDWMFGSYHLPDRRWPDHYGVQGERPPEGFLKQLLWPFKR